MDAIWNIVGVLAAVFLVVATVGVAIVARRWAVNDKKEDDIKGEIKALAKEVVTLSGQVSSVEAIMKGIPELYRKVNDQGERVARLEGQRRLPRSSRYDDEGSER